MTAQHHSRGGGIFSFPASGKVYVLDSSSILSNFSHTCNLIDDFANLLLDALKDQQWLAQDNRTLHLAGHSTGGLVVKRALTIAARNRNYAPIISACQSVAFFSTPHRGSSVLADPLLALSVRNELGLQNQLLEPLRNALVPESESIRIIDYDFASIARKLRQIWTFLELNETHLETLANRETGESINVRTPIVDSRSAILHIANERVIRLHCSHADMLIVSLHDLRQEVTAYHEGLVDLVKTQPLLSRNSEADLMQDVEVDLHVFAEEPSNDSKRPIKVWSYSARLADFLSLGPNGCLSSAPSRQQILDMDVSTGQNGSTIAKKVEPRKGSRRRSVACKFKRTTAALQPDMH